MPSVQIAEKYGVSPPTVNYLLNRAFTEDENGQYLLHRALIPGTVAKVPERHEALPNTGDDNPGYKCAFQNLLDSVPGLREELVAMIEAFVNRRRYAQNLTPRSFHDGLIGILKAKGWPQDVYPFDGSISQGYESARLFFHNEVARIKSEKATPKKIYEPKPRPEMPFWEIQIDAQTAVDIHNRVVLNFEGAVTDVPLSRTSLLKAVCITTNAVLAWNICLTNKPTQFDVLELIDRIFQKWTPWVLETPGLEYVPGAGYPSKVIDDIGQIGLNIVSLDNDFAHHAKSIRVALAMKYGALIRFGKSKRPLDRNFVEASFAEHNRVLTHRFSSTTGSHHKDPIRQTLANSKKPPILTLQSYMEATEVTISKHNATPMPGNWGETPLSLIRHAFRTMPARYAHNFKYYERDNFIFSREVNVYCNPKEKRGPLIKVWDIKYTGGDIRDRTLAGKPVRIEVDVRDIRIIEVFTLDGTRLGRLYAQRKYLPRRLSMKTWEVICEYQRRYRNLGYDPIAGLMRMMLAEKDLPKVATHVMRIFYETHDDNVLDLSDYRDEKTQFKPVSETQLDREVPVDIPSFGDAMKNFKINIS